MHQEVKRIQLIKLLANQRNWWTCHPRNETGG